MILDQLTNSTVGTNDFVLSNHRQLEIIEGCEGLVKVDMLQPLTLTN